jgi:hypothetical protein
MTDSKASFRAVFENHKGQCQYCDKPLKDFDSFWLAQRDRLIPGCMGGKYVMSNVVLSCAVCNNLRGNYVPPRIELTEFTRERYIADIKSEVGRRRAEKMRGDFDSWKMSIDAWHDDACIANQARESHGQ